MRSENPSVTSKAFEMMQGVEEISSRDQKRICKLLRRLGVNQVGLGDW
jgi:predicted aconitase